MGERNLKQEYAIKKSQEERLERTETCRVRGCNSKASPKTGLCGEHWRNRKKVKTSGYYNGK